jgi:hypothetical protein
MSPIDNLRLQRGAAHLHQLGARAVAEFLAELASRIGGAPAALSLLNEYARLTPGQVRAAGGERIPKRPLHVVADARGVGQ